MGGNHFVNDNLSIQGNMYYRHMERRNYNGDEFDGRDCGLILTEQVQQIIHYAANLKTNTAADAVKF